MVVFVLLHDYMVLTLTLTWIIEVFLQKHRYFYWYKLSKLKRKAKTNDGLVYFVYFRKDASPKYGLNSKVYWAI